MIVGHTHIVELLAKKEDCTEYAVFEAAALALCKVNHHAQAHLWWVRYEQAKRNLKPDNLLLGVSPEVINWCMDSYYPRGTFPQTTRRLMDRACQGRQ